MKKIWLLNHYATTMFDGKTGRHYEFARNLKDNGFEPTVFCAATYHNGNPTRTLEHKKYGVEYSENIPFVFIRAAEYRGNGISRVKNMLDFYRNLFGVAKKHAKEYGKPDYILASSVHPLTLLAGIKIAKRMKVPCICEVRDLWPASIVEFAGKSEKNILIKILYKLEKYLYRHADRLIFTMEGGRDYIIDKHWDKKIDLEKVEHINNGVYLELFEKNKAENVLDDKDLCDDGFKVIYAGSVRAANNVHQLIYAAEKLRDTDIKFIIFGDGPDRVGLENYCKEKELNNVVFKGKVDKKYIPYVISHSNLNILNYKNAKTWKYGGSQNKMFEYLAASKPILANVKIGYSLIERYNCGISENLTTPEEYADAIKKVYSLDKNEYQRFCENAYRAAKDYDYKRLSEKLIDILEKTK